MNSTVLQVPINVDLRKKADFMAESKGFSSIQEVVRVFLSRFAAGDVEVEFFPKSRLTPENEERYLKMIKQPSKAFGQFDNADDLLDYLER